MYNRGLVIILCVLLLLAIVACIFMGIGLEKVNNEANALRDEIEVLQKEIEQINTDTKEKHILDQEYKRAMSECSGSTLDIVNVIAFYGELWQEEMNKYYQLLYDELADDKKQWLVSSQEKWEVFTKENEELKWQTYDQINHGGTIMNIHTAAIFLDKYRTRALELESLYKVVTEKH